MKTVAEADADNKITRYYIYGAGLLAMVTPADKVYCYHYNAIGSTIAITDQEQNLVNKYAYAPFGEILNEEEEIPQPFKFVGRHGVMSESSGYYYMRARYYDPETGRFISEDPTGFEGGDVNLYAYAGNNPLLVIDPLGLCGDEIDLSGIESAFIASKILLLDDTSGIGVYDDYLIPFIMTAGISHAIYQNREAIAEAITEAALAIPSIFYAKEHTKNKRPSTKNDHEQGQSRQKRDKGREKGDLRRPYFGPGKHSGGRF